MAHIDRPGPNRARRALLASVLVVAGGVGLTSCAGDSNAARGATVVDVNLGRFVIEPAVLTAPAGDLQLRVTNVDPQMVHDLVVLGKGTRPLAPGESQTIDMPDVATGKYGMWCDVPGHAAMGQRGTLMVDPVPGPAATSS